MKVKNTSAFTLVELIVVIAVLAVLATVSFTTVANISQDARNSQRLTDMSTIGNSISMLSAQWGRINTTYLNPVAITLPAEDSSLWVGYLTGNVLPNLAVAPKDPDTNLPYAFSAYTGGSGSSLLVYGQVGTLIGVKDNPDTKILVKGNIDTVTKQSMHDILPRAALLDMPTFLASPYGQGTARMYGAVIGSPNRFLYAMSNTPAYITGALVDTSTIYYENFEGISAGAVNSQGVNLTTVNGPNEPRSNSLLTSAFTHSHDNGSSYFKFLKNGGAYPYNFIYTRINPSKKYVFSAKIKGTVTTSSVLAGRCGYIDNTFDNSIWANTIGNVDVAATVSSTYTTYSFSVNSTLPNNITVPATTRPVSCLINFSLTTATGDEVWFDDLLVKEVP